MNRPRDYSLPLLLLDNTKTLGPPQTVVLAGGCFWGVQAVFQHLNGVDRAATVRPRSLKRHTYIVVNDLPKVRNFQRMRPELYRAKPVTLGPVSR